MNGENIGELFAAFNVGGKDLFKDLRYAALVFHRHLIGMLILVYKFAQISAVHLFQGVPEKDGALSKGRRTAQQQDKHQHE